MAERFNEPNFSFIVETLTQEGDHLCYWRIDQVLQSRASNFASDALHNQVNRHLSVISRRLGLRFGVVLSGPLEIVNHAAKMFGYEIS